MSNHRVRAVVFDAVGTLMTPRPRVATAYWEHGRRFGSRFGEAEIRARFYEVFAREEARDQADGGRTSEVRERERWRAIVAEVLPDAEDPNGLFAALWEHFSDARNWALFDEVPRVWNELRTAGWLLAVGSNFDRRLHDIWRGMPLGNGCARVFVSSELGVRKPRPEFFAQVSAGLAVEPEAILMVGDDFENDYTGAKQAGWQAVLLDRSGRHAAVEPGITRIATLAELPGLLSARMS